MIKLKDLITEAVSKSVVTKLMLMPNPKIIEAEYVDVGGKKIKEKFKVKKTTESVGYYTIQVGKVKSQPKEFNNYEFIIDKDKLNIKLRASMGYAKNLTSDKILKIKAR